MQTKRRLLAAAMFAALISRLHAAELKRGKGNAVAPPMLASAAEQALYLKPTEFIPTDGIVRETSMKITKGARTDVEKARAITTGRSRTPSAMRRRAAAEWATSRRCSKETA